MPQSENVDKLPDPGQTKVTSSAVYRSIPNAALIDRELGSDDTGWLVTESASPSDAPASAGPPGFYCLAYYARLLTSRSIAAPVSIRAVSRS
jgi:hypothetical protein